MYEYVNKSEYAPIRKELEKIIKRAQGEMRKEHKLSFQFQLIGSGRRHLVTRKQGGNGGYDFDYNLIIPPPEKGYQADILKQKFMAAFKTALKGTQYSFPKDSTSAITIKVVDKNNKRVLYSCDFAIIYYGKCDGNDGYYYLRNNKKNHAYEFAFRSLGSGIGEKVDYIRKHNGWNHIRKEYLKLKNINGRRNKKHSFSIYVEAVNNVYNHMKRRIFYEEIVF